MEASTELGPLVNAEAITTLCADIQKSVEAGAKVLTGGKAFGGALARQARFALYTSRLPTWHHRLRVGASWFFEGTQMKPI